nr:hypothetical protein [Rhabdothermincola sediminis]
MGQARMVAAISSASAPDRSIQGRAPTSNTSGNRRKQMAVWMQRVASQSTRMWAFSQARVTSRVRGSPA